MNFKIISLNLGSKQKLLVANKLVESSFNKKPVERARLSKLGLVGDSQADLKNHGGIDKAICVFSQHNFHIFERELNRSLEIPAFGENFTVDKLVEEEVFIGDVFTCGEVKLQISQPRQPCSKTGAFHKKNSLIKKMSNSGATGFYFRVLNEGSVSRGDVFERTETDKKFSLKFCNDIMYGRNKSRVDLENLISCKYLSNAWCEDLSRRLG